MGRHVLRGVAVVVAGVALCTLGGTAAGVTTRGVAAAAAGQPLRASLATPPPCPKGSERPLYRYTRYSFAERAADLVSCMTLAEKIAQLHTTVAPAIPRLGIQQYAYDTEGLHGVYRLGGDTNPGGQTGK